MESGEERTEDYKCGGKRMSRATLSACLIDLYMTRVSHAINLTESASVRSLPLLQRKMGFYLCRTTPSTGHIKLMIEPMETPLLAEYFVYVYRDKAGNPVYFGQGRHASRPAEHKSGSHNQKFGEWLRVQAGQHRVEVIGPLLSKEMANAVETALISACMPAKALQKNFFNLHKGIGRFRFRPWGVPEKFAVRTADPIGKKELLALCREHGPVMFVRINQKNFDEGKDERLGYDLASPPSDEKLLARLDRWWQVRSRVAEWTAKPSLSPAVLIGVTGAPGAQVIIASVHIDRDGWPGAEVMAQGLLRIPVLQKNGLDAANLRGRPIDRDVELKFDRSRQSSFRILTSKGFQHILSKVAYDR